MAQAVRRSPPTAGVPSSRLGLSMWVSWWTKRGLGKFFSGFLPFSPTTNFIPHFSTLISSISFNFISPCDGASGVVGRHPCYSRIYNIGASSHLIPRPDLVLDTSSGYLFIINNNINNNNNNFNNKYKRRGKTKRKKERKKKDKNSKNYVTTFQTCGHKLPRIYCPLRKSLNNISGQIIILSRCSNRIFSANSQSIYKSRKFRS